MKTAQDVIMDFQKLAPDQQNEVRDFVNSVQEQDDFSEEETALILQASEDAKRGINMSGPFNTTEEIFDHLDSLKPEK